MKNPRRVYASNINDYEFQQDSPSEVAEDIENDADASASTLLANLMNRNPPNSNIYLSSEDFNSLSPQAKNAWRALPNDLKAALAKSRNSSQGSNSYNNNHSDHSNPSYKPVKPPSCTRNIPPSSARNIPPSSECIHADIPPSSECAHEDIPPSSEF